MLESSARQPLLVLRSTLCAGLLLASAGAAVAEGFEIVLRVNEQIATSYDFQRRQAEKIRAIQASERLPAERRQRLLAEVGVATMNELFEELLMLSRAEQLGIKVSEAEIDRSLENTKENVGIETEEQFQQALQSSNMTVEQLRRTLRNSLLMQKLMAEEIQPRISLEEEDLRRYYRRHSEDFEQPERLQLREVVVLESSGVEKDDLLRVAEEIRQQLLSGKALEEVVRPYAERGLSSNAVDLGWVERGDLDSELEEAVWVLEPGGISAPVAGRGGYHVLLVSDRQEAYLQSFAEVEDQIRAREGDRLLAAEMQKYAEELQAQAYIVANPPPEAAGFRAALSTSTEAQSLGDALSAPLTPEALDSESENPLEPANREDSPDAEATSDPPRLP